MEKHIDAWGPKWKLKEIQNKMDILATGIIPDSWAFNSIVPIYKLRGDRESMDFHRPICLMDS